MPTINQLRRLSLSLPEATEEPHFEKICFKVRKKIFVTYDPSNNKATVKLSLLLQDVFSSASSNIIYPVPNKWGTKGWTIIELDTVHEDLLTDIITSAYCEVAPKTLAKSVRPKDQEL